MGLTKKLELIGTIELDEAEINSITPDTGNHLDLNAVASKDLRLYLSDNAGARKLLIYDSDDALVASIDSNGVIDGSKMTAPLTYAEAETSGAPTNAECVSAFGAAATVGAGFIGVLQDTAAEGVSYLCVSNGTNYDVFTGVAGA